MVTSDPTHTRANHRRRVHLPTRQRRQQGALGNGPSANPSRHEHELLRDELKLKPESAARRRREPPQIRRLCEQLAQLERHR